jgi:hypothetical protein
MEDSRNPRWTVKLSEIYEDQRAGEKPTPLSSFDVAGGPNTDTAKKAARDWLQERGYRLRSLGVCDPVSAHIMTAVVMKKRPDPATVTTALASPAETPTLHAPRGAGAAPARSARVPPRIVVKKGQ